MPPPTTATTNTTTNINHDDTTPPSTTIMNPTISPNPRRRKTAKVVGGDTTSRAANAVLEKVKNKEKQHKEKKQKEKTTATTTSTTTTTTTGSRSHKRRSSGSTHKNKQPQQQPQPQQQGSSDAASTSAATTLTAKSYKVPLSPESPSSKLKWSSSRRKRNTGHTSKYSFRLEGEEQEQEQGRGKPTKREEGPMHASFLTISSSSVSLFSTTSSSTMTSNTVRTADILPILQQLNGKTTALTNAAFQKLVEWAHDESSRNKLLLLGVIPMVMEFMKRTIKTTTSASSASVTSTSKKEMSTTGIWQACSLLYQLNINDETSEVICAHGGIDLMVTTLKHQYGIAPLEWLVCQILADLAYCDGQTFDSPYAMMIRQILIHDGSVLLGGLFLILHNPSSDQDVLSSAFRALWNISFVCPPCNHDIVQQGGILTSLHIIATYPDSHDLIYKVLSTMNNVTFTEPRLDTIEIKSICTVILFLLERYPDPSSTLQVKACAIVQNLMTLDDNLTILIHVIVSIMKKFPHQEALQSNSCRLIQLTPMSPKTQRILMDAGCLTVLVTLVNVPNVSTTLQDIALETIHFITTHQSKQEQQRNTTAKKRNSGSSRTSTTKHTPTDPTWTPSE